jgi:hypothetical protein
VPLGGRAPSLVKGFSDGPDVGLDGWMLIFGFGAGSTLPEAAGVEGGDVEDGPPLSPPESCSLFGFAGADSFCMRRLRIWRRVSSGNAHDKRQTRSDLIHLLLIWGIRSVRWRLWIVLHDGDVYSKGRVVGVKSVALWSPSK